MRKISVAAMSLGLAALVSASPAFAQYGMDKKGPKNAATPELPQCAKPLGRAAIKEPQTQWWVQYGLGSPEVLIKLFASRSNCLRIVDRNGGLAMRNEEAALGAGGDLKRGSNLGKGQVAAADYFIIPDLANSNSNSRRQQHWRSGRRIRPPAGWPGRDRRLDQHQEVRSPGAGHPGRRPATTEQLYVAEGVHVAEDRHLVRRGRRRLWLERLRCGGRRRLLQHRPGQGHLGGLLQARFVDLIGYLQKNAPTGEQASQAAGIQAYSVKSPVVMRKTPSPQARPPCCSFNPGDMVFPTGQKNGIWWEVDDENGNRGWVSSAMISTHP